MHSYKKFSFKKDTLYCVLKIKDGGENFEILTLGSQILHNFLLFTLLRC